MLIVSKNDEIQLTRGDTARLTVDLDIELEDNTKQPYSMQEGDTITLTVKRNVKLNDFCFQKKSKGSNTFHIKPEDTKALPFGIYVYDVELVTAEGDTYTVIEKNIFKICEEVT